MTGYSIPGSREGNSHLLRESFYQIVIICITQSPVGELFTVYSLIIIILKQNNNNAKTEFGSLQESLSPKCKNIYKLWILYNENVLSVIYSYIILLMLASNFR